MSDIDSVDETLVEPVKDTLQDKSESVKDTPQDKSQHDNNTVLPTELFIEIINNIKFNSNQFLIDYINILNAIKQLSNKPLLNYLTKNISNSIDILNFVKLDTIPTNTFTSNLYKFFTNWKPSITKKKDKFILIIGHSLLNSIENYTSFKQGFLDKYFTFKYDDYCNISFDIIYIPTLTEVSPQDEQGYMCATTNNNLMKFISYFPQNFILDNLIIDFDHDKVILPKDLFGIYTSQFFIFHDDLDITSHNNNSSKWLQPRCNQITFPNVTHFAIDYMAMDTFISDIFENYGISQSSYHYNDPYGHYGRGSPYYSRSSTPLQYNSSYSQNGSVSPVQYLLNIFLTKVTFYCPQLIDLKFNDKNSPNATCNFIDLSTNILSKLLKNHCALKSYFEMHSLPNWQMKNLNTFGGHRFKFDVTTKSQSSEDSIVKITANIKYLAKMINDQTKDGVSYLRVSLFPPTTKKSKILNWLPLGSSESLQETSETGRTVSPTRTTASKEVKPILCLNSSSLEVLELRVLTVDLNKNNHIQGLFLPNLKKLILQNFQFDVNSPYKVTSNNWDDNDQIMVNDMNLYPTGFSSWNALQNCELITLIDNIQKSDQKKCHSIHLIFNIKNLKQTMPKIKLRESFYTFVDERQQFIVV